MRFSGQIRLYFGNVDRTLFRIRNKRHSYASRALATGESLPMIGRLLGHSEVETTARYAHLAEDSVKESAARVAESIAADLLPQYRAHTPPAGA